MITEFRRYTESWIARGFFMIMAVAFVGWGVSADLQRVMGPPTWVAKVGGQTIEIPAFQAEFQRTLAQRTRDLPPGQEASADLRRQVGQQTLNRMITQAALGATLADLHIVTPDDALATVVRGMPAFRGTDGKFSRAVFENLLRTNGYTETRFLADLRSNVSQQQLVATLSASAAVPDAELRAIYQITLEKRAADMAVITLAAQPEPATPSETVLQRWYDNHPDSYTTPEYRRIKAIELTPQSLASDVAISDEELRTAYDSRKADYVSAEKRSAQILSASDEAKANGLAEKWRAGADWAAIQDAAKAAGVASLTNDDATQVEYPDPDLAKAVFGAREGAIVGPVHGQLGWFVVQVTKVTEGNTVTFDQAKAALRDRLLASKAADLMYERANKVDQILGNGASFDEIPGDLGVAGIAGTMDAKGMTTAGQPAPIPGPEELRKAIIAAAFDAHQGDQPQLTEVQTPSTGGSAYYALVVESIDPPAAKPFDTVKTQVDDDWKQDQRRRAADKTATAMMTAVQGGKSFSDAALVAGVTPKLSPAVTRDQPSADVPPELQRVLFDLKSGETTMTEVPEGFVVAQLVEVVKPDPAQDKTGYEQMKTTLNRSLGTDLGNEFADAVRSGAKPQINQANYDSIVQAR